MNRKYFLYTLTTSLVFGLTSCTSEDFWETFDRTVDGPIDFTVGVESSPVNQAKTRAGEPTYYSMQGGTQVRMRVDGIWKKGSTDNSISQKTTCKINSTNPAQLDFAEGETLYWDDYGAGDPGNSVNTDKGLSILAVAVDGMKSAPAISTDAEWESLSWPLITNGVNVLEGDIIVSNNLTAYKFAERGDEYPDAKKMIFSHPLSKITFNIKAGQGFDANSFDPTVTLSKATKLDDVDVESNNYALVYGSVNIKGGTAQADDTMAPAKVLACKTSTTTEGVIKQAIVYPGTQLGADNDAVIAVLQIDGNNYYIKAKEIHDKMTNHPDFKTKAGENYIIKVTVNKTGIRATATVTKWDTVESDEVYPVINVDTKIGGGSTPPSGFNAFAFWRSENKNMDYINEATPTVNLDGTTDWPNNSTLYWTNHNQHYHFRGIYPSNTEVKKDNTDEHQYVEVQNGVYNSSSFPSNFVIGMPEFGDNDYMCDNDDHEHKDMREYGICARTSAINLNFRYMMSQVEVNLSSTDTSAKDYVDLSYCKVELVNVGNDGKIMLSDRSAHYTDDGKQTFVLPFVSGMNYHGIIIPQTLKNTDDSNKVRIKITVYSDAEKTVVEDIYYADVAPIKVKKKGAEDSTAAATDAWESGVHYVYNLKITKTEIKATATLTDWTTVEASEDVWF